MAADGLAVRILTPTRNVSTTIRADPEGDTATRGEVAGKRGFQPADPVAALDLELVRRVLDGDEEATRQFLARMVCIERFVLRLDRNSRIRGTSLADIQQDVFMRVWSSLVRYQGKAGLEIWIWGFVQHTFESFLRTEIRWRTMPRRLVEARPERADFSVEVPCPIALDREHLWQRFREVPSQLRVLLEARFLEGASFDDLARRLGISRTAAKRRYYRALEQVQEWCRVR